MKAKTATVEPKQQHKETKAEAANRKEIAKEQLEAIRPLLENLWHEAKGQTIPMFIGYCTQGQGDEQVDVHFDGHGLEHLEEKLQDAFKRVINGQVLWYTVYQEAEAKPTAQGEKV